MSMPIVSAPPGRLSTTTCCPRNLDISGVTMREIVSVALPGACGTTKRIGFSGYCASAVPARTAATAATRTWIIGSPPADQRSEVDVLRRVEADAERVVAAAVEEQR